MTNKGNFFVLSAGLTPKEEKYCRCILKVAAKQPESCNSEKAWFQEREGQKCYNPYAVCASSTGTSSRSCGASYDYENLSDEHLRAYASLKNISIPDPYDRGKLLEAIKAHKAGEK